VSNPPPNAVPWMAAITGLGQSSSACSIGERPTSLDFCPDVSLPNSLMSAPAGKLRPAPPRAMALGRSSLRSWLRAAIPASGTPGPSALTGGLSIVTTPIVPSFVPFTSSLMDSLLTPGIASCGGQLPDADVTVEVDIPDCRPFAQPP